MNGRDLTLGLVASLGAIGIASKRGSRSIDAAPIAIVGVGSGARHVLNLLAAPGDVRARLLLVDTNVQDLKRSRVPTLRVGAAITRGLGASGDAEVGRAAAETDASVIATAIAGSRLVLIVACLGGGTGSGAAPIVARVAQEQGATVFAIVSLPLPFEGRLRERTARAALDVLEGILPNCVLLSETPMPPREEGVSIVDMFARRDASMVEIVRSALTVGSRSHRSRATRPVAFSTGREAKAAALARRDAVTQTDTFRSWFGQSVVVDADQRPQVCYHGTSTMGDHADFTEFSAEHAPDRGGLLAFFAVEPSFADGYSKTCTGPDVRARIYPVYLSIQDPFDFRTMWREARAFYDEEGGIRDDMEARRILMGLGDEGCQADEDPVEDIMDERYSADDLTMKMFVEVVRRGGWDALEAFEFVEWLRRRGYDGIVLLEGGSVNYGIFEPTQVKSATGNTGSFDPEEPDISLNRRAPRRRRS